MAVNANYNVLVYISAASQTQGSQRKNMLFSLAVNPIETVTLRRNCNYSFTAASGEGE